jgi:aspartate racemase
MRTDLNESSKLGRGKHIGIVGCSSEGAALCYRTICLEAGSEMGAYHHPEVSLHTHSLGRYVPLVHDGDWRGVGELLLSSAQKLASAGAELLICPDNTVHQAFSYVESRLPLPWLHIAAEVVREASVRGYRRLAILGTRSLMESPVYAEQLAATDIQHCTPSFEERVEVDRIIFEELVSGTLTPRSRQRVRDIIDRLAKDEHCDAVVLGCTELPLLVAWDRPAVPTLDSTRLLARAALRAALA